MTYAARPIAFWRRSVTWRQDHLIHFDEYALDSRVISNADGEQPVADGMTDPLAQSALRKPEMASFARWSILPMAQVTRERCRVVVAFQDARFGRRPGAGRLGQSTTIPSSEQGC